MPGSGKHLIVGWPRGGLGYVAQLLRQAGYEVGQDLGLHVNYANLATYWEKTQPIEVSVALVPYLSHPVLQDTQITLVLRDPMRVLNSLCFHGAFQGERLTPSLRLACRHLFKFWEQYRGRPVQATATFLLRWHELAITRRPDIRVLRVEEGNRELLQGLLRLEQVPPVYCAPDVNASGCKQLLTPAHLPEVVRLPMQRLMYRLGYLDSVWNPRGGHAHYINPDWHC